MVKLRLMRMGKKKQPFYRIVAADSRSPRNGRFIEIIGTYDPRQDPSAIEVDNEKAARWLRNGAQPSERVRKILRISGAWDLFQGLPEGTSAPAVPAPRGDEVGGEAAAEADPDPVVVGAAEPSGSDEGEAS